MVERKSIGVSLSNYERLADNDFNDIISNWMIMRNILIEVDKEFANGYEVHFFLEEIELKRSLLKKSCCL